MPQRALKKPVDNNVYGFFSIKIVQINELLMTCGMPQVIYNRGVGGFTTDDMLRNMEEMVFALNPRKIFINIGTNDIANENYCLERLMGNGASACLLRVPMEIFVLRIR